VSASFVTLARAQRAETREKGSRFIATAIPADDEQKARLAIEAVRSEFPDATHHCWAYAIQSGRAVPEERCHDAGEPGGTAGPPILQAIRGAGLRDVIVVVTRYFGGTKLGKGGLARAYRVAAARALEGAPTLAVVPVSRLVVDVPLSLDGETRHLVARHAGRVESSSYDDPPRCVLRVVVPVDRRGQFRSDLQALARGEARLRDIGEAI